MGANKNSFQFKTSKRHIHVFWRPWIRDWWCLLGYLKEGTCLPGFHGNLKAFTIKIEIRNRLIDWYETRMIFWVWIAFCYSLPCLI